MKLESLEKEIKPQFHGGEVEQEKSNAKLVELSLVLKALDKVRQPKFKLYFHSCVYPVHLHELMSLLIFTPCLFPFRNPIFIKLCNCGYTNVVLFGELLYSFLLGL